MNTIASKRRAEARFYKWVANVLVGVALWGSAGVVARGQGLGMIAEPKRDDPSSTLVHSTASLRAAFPALEELEAGGVGTRPHAYEGPTVDVQPLRVLRNDEKDVGTIILGHDALGATRLRLMLERDTEGKLVTKSMGGAPGSEWVLPRDEFITLGDIRVRGFRLRVSVGPYESQDPVSGQKQTIENIVRIETQNVDDARPGELVYASEGQPPSRFVLSESRGVFVFTQYLSKEAHLVTVRGWTRRTDEPGSGAPSTRSASPPGRAPTTGPSRAPATAPSQVRLADGVLCSVAAVNELRVSGKAGDLDSRFSCIADLHGEFAFWGMKKGSTLEKSTIELPSPGTVFVETLLLFENPGPELRTVALQFDEERPVMRAGLGLGLKFPAWELLPSGAVDNYSGWRASIASSGTLALQWTISGEIHCELKPGQKAWLAASFQIPESEVPKYHAAADVVLDIKGATLPLRKDAR